MRAVVLREIGPPENLRLEEVPDPTPGADEVVVRLKAAALNHRDVWIRTGKYSGITLPIILGSDGAGNVEKVGDSVDPALVGTDVMIFPTLGWGDDPRVQRSDFRILGLPDDGTYAERVKVPAVNVFRKPPALTFEEAAAIPLGALTAYRAVVTRGRVAAGETVLVTGIGGGVATFALQIARHRGARVLVTSGSDAKIERARRLGAAGGANYRTADWVKEILAINNGVGPDVIIDSAGGDVFDKALELVKPGGRIVLFGVTAGPVANATIRRIYWKQLDVLGTTMGTAEEFSEVIRLYGEGGLKPVIDSVFPLELVSEAHRRMEQAEQFGRIVLRIE